MNPSRLQCCGGRMINGGTQCEICGSDGKFEDDHYPRNPVDRDAPQEDHYPREEISLFPIDEEVDYF